MQSLKVKHLNGLNIDLALEKGEDGNVHLARIKGWEEFKQANWMGTSAQQGQWFFNRQMGLPWLEHPKLPPGREFILGSKPALDPELIAIYAYQQLKREPRNEQVTFPTVTPDPDSIRTFKIVATVYSTDYGTHTLSI